MFSYFIGTWLCKGVCPSFDVTWVCDACVALLTLPVCLLNYRQHCPRLRVMLARPNVRIVYV